MTAERLSDTKSHGVAMRVVELPDHSRSCCFVARVPREWDIALAYVPGWGKHLMQATVVPTTHADVLNHQESLKRPLGCLLQGSL